MQIEPRRHGEILFVVLDGRWTRSALEIGSTSTPRSTDRPRVAVNSATVDAVPTSGALHRFAYQSCSPTETDQKYVQGLLEPVHIGDQCHTRHEHIHQPETRTRALDCKLPSAAGSWAWTAIVKTCTRLKTT